MIKYTKPERERETMNFAYRAGEINESVIRQYIRNQENADRIADGI